jgi:hypothetical protein
VRYSDSRYNNLLLLKALWHLRHHDSKIDPGADTLPYYSYETFVPSSPTCEVPSTHG